MNLHDIICKQPAAMFYGLHYDSKFELLAINADSKCVAQYNFYFDTKSYVDVTDDDTVNHRSPEDALGDTLEEILEVREGSFDKVFIISKCNSDDWAVDVKLTEITWDKEADVLDLPTNVEHRFDYSGSSDTLVDDIAEWLSSEYEECFEDYRYRIVDVIGNYSVWFGEDLKNTETEGWSVADNLAGIIAEVEGSAFCNK